MNLSLENIKSNKKYESKAFLICAFAILICFFYPMSKSGKLMTSSETVIYYCISLLPIFLLFIWGNKLIIKAASIGVFLLLYLGIATIFAVYVFNTNFSIARFAPIAIAVFVLSTKIIYTPKQKVLIAFFEIITIFVFMINLLILTGNEFINQFLLNNYKQFLDYTVYISLLNKKPVFTFGVHSYASFFYMLMFYLWYATQKNDLLKKKRYYFYLFTILFFNILLASSTSLGFSFFMIVLLLKLAKSITKKITFISTFIIAGFILISSSLIDKYQYMLSSSTNGFLGRYSSNIFNYNTKAISQCWLGIGYTIPLNVYFADSGYLVLFTIGNVILPITIYTMLWFFLKRNVPNHKIYLFVIIMLFEFALSSLTYMKTILFLIFATFYLKSIDNSVINKKEL